MKTHTIRIHDARRTLERCLQFYGLRQLNGDTELVKAGEQIITKIEAAVEAFACLSMPKTPDRYPSKLERIVSLANGLEAVARERGAATLAAESLHRLVVSALNDEDCDFWSTQPVGSITGYIADEPQLTDELKARGILAWQFNLDPLTQLVDTQWLQTHADIYAHIVCESPPGQRCRFCRLTEEDSSKLVDFNLQIGERINTKVSVHAQCYQSFGNWVTLAKNYPTIEAAMAADAAAGRTQVAVVPALPTPPDLGPGPGPHYCEKRE